MKRKLCLFIVFVLMICAAPVFGSGSVKIEEWQIPAGDKFPHDPAVAPDGALWYTGMGSNTLGRLDVKSGQFRSYPLKTPDSGPHGLVADNSGNIWFTANYKGYIGKLDPTTGTVTEFPLPDKDARDPHTLVFDNKGTLWFTVQKGNFVGRLDPATGKFVLKSPPSRDSRPYGIAISPQGVPFFCEFGTNRIGRIDPASMAVTEFQLPQGARPRRIAVTSDDMVWYSDYQRGYLGRLDPRTGRVEEWQSPGGRKSHPYGMAATPDGMIWYSESGVEPNTIVRFDPRTKNFATWPVPSGGGVIRHMVATPQGDVYIACSGEYKVGVVRVSHRDTGKDEALRKPIGILIF
jgi:virginiamycin B lyase